jgi:hypothetical protein
MNILGPLFAGLFGTYVMSLFTEFAFNIVNRDYHVVKILGNMLMVRKNEISIVHPPAEIYTMAVFLHYTIGGLFAYVYYWTKTHAILIDTVDDVFFATAIATLAISGWRVFFAFHPNPPPVQLKYFLPIIWIGHIILSMIFIGTYAITSPEVIAEAIPVCS